jgi:hypothetical protein
MIKVISINTDQVVAVQINGTIHKADIEAIEQAFADKFGRFDKVSIYVEVIALGGITLNALVEDLKFAFSKFSRFEKKAVVSEHQWMGPLAEIGDRLFPSIQVKHFSFDEKDAAMEWISKPLISSSEA